MRYDMAGNLIDEERPQLVDAPQVRAPGALVAPEPYAPVYGEDQRMNPRRQLWAGMLMDMGNLFGGWNGSNYGGRQLQGTGFHMQNQARNWNSRMDAANSAAQRQYAQDQNQYVMNQAKLHQMGMPDLTTKQREYQYAQQQGYQGDFMQYLEDTKAAGVNVNVGGSGVAGTTPLQVASDQQARELGYNPDTTLVQIDDKGRTTATPKHTPAQEKTAGFVQRVQAAEEGLMGVTSGGYNPAGPSMPKIVPDFLRPENEKMYKNHRDEWIRSVLRRESGAAISDEERGEFAKFFPKVGDSQAIIEQKRRQRHTVLESIASEAGNAWRGGTGYPYPGLDDDIGELDY